MDTISSHTPREELKSRLNRGPLGFSTQDTGEGGYTLLKTSTKEIHAEQIAVAPSFFTFYGRMSLANTYYGLNCVLSNSYVEVQMHSTSDCDNIWN